MDFKERVLAYKRKKALSALELNEEIEYCYIKKRGVYYAPDCAGYTEYRFHAGVYKKDKAIREARYCDELTIIPIDIEEHNKMVRERIAEIETRLILA